MFGRKPSKSASPVTETSQEVREALHRLDVLAQTRPELAGPVQFSREIIPLLFEPARAHPVEFSEGEVSERLRSGTPLLRGISIDIADAMLLANWQNICTVLARLQEAEPPHRLCEAASRGELLPRQALERVLAAGPAEFRTMLEDQGLDWRLGMSVLRLAALPVLLPLAEALAPIWQRRGWPYGYCPACGSWPLLAEFRGLEQFRWLRCGLCGSGWQVDRLFCPFCETRDHRQLQDLTLEGQEQKYRVSVCDNCRGYVRGMATLAPLTPPGLLVAELETLPLELLAQQQGYRVPDRPLDGSCDMI